MFQLLTYLGNRIRAKGNAGDIVIKVGNTDNPQRSIPVSWDVCSTTRESYTSALREISKCFGRQVENKVG